MRPLTKVLMVLQEECAEVVQAVSKIHRFGLHDDYLGNTNVDRLAEEIGHVKCMILEAQALIPELTDEKIIKAIFKKEKKLNYWLPHEGEVGYIPAGGPDESRD